MGQIGGKITTPSRRKVHSGAAGAAVTNVIGSMEEKGVLGNTILNSCKETGVTIAQDVHLMVHEHIHVFFSTAKS